MVIPDPPADHGGVTLEKATSLTRISDVCNVVIKSDSSESPIKENLAPTTLDNNSLRHVNSRWSFSSSVRSFGSSKDEIFYESCPWLPSDSEDDFYSVNGDFTPSRGNTPKCSFSDRPPRFHNPLFDGEKPRVSFSQSPAPRRKKLGELFRDSIREEREESFEESPEDQSEMNKKSSSDNSVALIIIEDSTKDKKNLKSSNYHHRCLPRLPSFKNGLMEKRKKKKKIHVK